MDRIADNNLLLTYQSTIINITSNGTGKSMELNSVNQDMGVSF